MFVIGLTGGIGSGKSTIADYFTKLGIDVIDADKIAREVVTPHSAALNEIAVHFGTSALNKDGSLNRGALRRTIFADPKERRWLEALLHPLIRERLEQDIAHSSSPYVVVVIPLLIESSYQYPIDRVLVIDTPEAQQRSRTHLRDQISKEEIENIISAQVSREQRLAAADDIIHNDKGIEELEQQVNKLHQYYLSLSEQKTS
jgi:dephospho-CoA kinase